MAGPPERLREHAVHGRVSSVAGADGGEGLRIDTSGLDATYHSEGLPPLLTPGGRQALRTLVVGGLVALGLFAVFGPGQLAHLVPLAVFGLGGEMLARALDRTTRVSPTHLDVRPAGRRRVVPWDDVRELVPPTAFGDGGRAHLADGTTVPLPNVPAEHVERLGAAIEEARRREHGAREGAS
ncbi:PH domain-containing protein [Pseudokineococcus lusitanus]|uniref:PH domain-containing protein n=1 Tax=Pseudokineococcus lusitanus TaxID=763993 RepID=UPI0011CDC48D|nr:PH domain-containing protein [Pseudokineococcus lusitanus]